MACSRNSMNRSAELRVVRMWIPFPRRKSGMKFCGCFTKKISLHQQSTDEWAAAFACFELAESWRRPMMHMARPPTGPNAKDQTLHILRKTIEKGGGTFIEHKDNVVTFRDRLTGRKVS